MTQHPKPVQARLSDETAERVRRSHATAIEALQAMPASALTVISGVTLVDGIATTVKHGLGRAPRIVIHGVPRGASSTGRIDEVDNPSRSQFLLLRATGYTATITVDLAVL